MHPAALLDLTTELLRAVLKLDSPADSVVSAFFRRHRTLGPRERHTLAEIGRMLDVSRERVRQVELKALRKLRHLTRRMPTAM